MKLDAKELLDLYTSQHRTLEQIAIKKGITRERVRQLINVFPEYRKERKRRMARERTFKALLVDSLEAPFYLNVVTFEYAPGKWSPVWMKEYAGSVYRREALEMRRAFLNYLLENGSDAWRAKDLKTVKVTLFS
jgi:hypothetical protein